jgi:phosphonate transport system substrate-binding protein
MKISLKLLATVFCLIPMMACSKKEENKDEVVFGFNPAENVDVVQANSEIFAKYYKEHTGKTIKTFIATDYTALIEAMRAGRIDFAFLPPFSFVKGETIAKAKVLLKAVRKGKAHYYSAIIVRADKGINTLDDLKGKSIAWTDPSSTAGHMIPKAAIMNQFKVEPDQFFGKQVFAGAYDSVLLSVLNGTVDAGAVFSDDESGAEGAHTQLLKTPEEQKKLKVIFVSKPITGDTMSTTEAFAAKHPEIVEKTVKLLEEMSNSEEGKKILKDLYRIDSMIKADTKDYEPIREAAKQLNIL